MKKIFMGFIFLCICFNAYPAWWDGGAARMLALGSVNIALPDSTNIIDLYAKGYASALAYREQAGIITASPYYSQMNGNLDSGGNFDAIPASFTFWLTQNDAISVHPGYIYQFSSSGNSTAEIKMGENSGALNVDYSRIFGNGLAAGLKIGYGLVYSSSYMQSHIWFMPDYGNRITSQYLDFLLDADMRINDDTVIALSAGNVLPRDLIQNSRPGAYTELLSRIAGMYDGYFGTESLLGAAAGGYNNFSSAGYCLNAGIGYASAAGIEAAASAGVVLAYTNDFKGYTAANTLSYDGHTAGLAYNADISARSHVGDFLIAGLSTRLSAEDYSYRYFNAGVTYTGMDTAYNSEESAGFTLKAGGFRLPAEFFSNFSNLNRYGGIRGGLEWDAAQWLSVRAGINWPFIKEHFTNSGTNFDYTFSAGFGVNFSSLQADLGAAYHSYSSWASMPFPMGIIRMYEYDLDVLLGVTYKL